MNSILMSYFLAAIAGSGVFLVAGWRTKRGIASVDNNGTAPPDALLDGPELDLHQSTPEADVGAAVRLALKRVASDVTSQSVQIDLAAPPGLLARMRGAPLTDLLEELFAASIHAAPASRILITAAVRGERVYVSVTDDMPNSDPVVRAASARGLMERVAMRGGALDIDVRPSEGTTLTLRLAAAIAGKAMPEPPTRIGGSLIPTTGENA